MTRIVTVLSAAILTAGLFAGCDVDRRGAKVAPQTEIDQSDDYGYSGGGNRDYGYEASDYAGYDDSAVPADNSDLNTVYFDYDKFQLNKPALDIMSANAERMWSHPRLVVLIEGHCDERGTEEYNLALGEKRAREVKDYLTKYGIDPGRLSIISYGESMPADLGHSEKSWSKNRRASFAVLSK